MTHYLGSIYDTGSGQQAAWYDDVEAAMNSGATDDTQQEGVDIDPSTIVGMIAVTELDDSAATGASGYDHEGNLTTYRYSYLGNEYPAALPVGVTIGEVDTYTVHYLKKDSYLEQSTAGSSTNSERLPASDVSTYDAFGRRIAITQQVQQDDGTVAEPVRVFAYDAEGQILERRDGTASGSTFTATGGAATHHYAYVQGQQIGEVDEAGGIDVLSGVTGFSNTDQGSSTYVVQNDDNLESIAQAAYGDASLWYVVADANGLDSDASLAPGQTLTLPQVTTTSNTAETFKPYNPSKVSGSTTPSLPQAPPPAASGCNALAEIVVLVVVIVASIFTAGVAAEIAAGTLGTAAGGGAAGIMAAGGAAFAGGAAAGTVAGTAIGVGTAAADGLGTLAVSAAIGGAVGDAAGQLVGDAEGIHQGFSWGEMAGAGLGAGITAGLSGAITGGESIQSLAKAGTWAAGAKIAGVGAAGAIGSYTGEKLAGQPAHFSWTNVVAAALSTEITAKIGLPTNTQLSEGESSGHFLEDLGGSLVNGAIDSETARLLGGNAQNGRQIVEDAFGNALGNAAIAGIEEANAHSGQSPHAQTYAYGKGPTTTQLTMQTVSANGSALRPYGTAFGNAVAFGDKAYSVDDAGGPTYDEVVIDGR